MWECQCGVPHHLCTLMTYVRRISEKSSRKVLLSLQQFSKSVQLINCASFCRKNTKDDCVLPICHKKFGRNRFYLSVSTFSLPTPGKRSLFLFFFYPIFISYRFSVIFQQTFNDTVLSWLRITTLFRNIFTNGVHAHQW